MGVIRVFVFGRHEDIVVLMYGVDYNCSIYSVQETQGHIITFSTSESI